MLVLQLNIENTMEEVTISFALLNDLNFMCFPIQRNIKFANS